jgi:hypothetical protein
VKAGGEYQSAQPQELCSIAMCMTVEFNIGQLPFCKPLRGALSGSAAIAVATCGKSLPSMSSQDVQVYKMCSSSLQVLADARGNHDAYNVPLRGAPGDFYATYARTEELISARATVKDVFDGNGASCKKPGQSWPQI